MQIELAVAVTHARCPLPARIMVPSVRKVIGVRIGDLLQGVGTIFPVHQVFRLQDGRAWEEIHGRSHQIIGIIHADYVRVREVGVDNRIDKGPLPVVGRPPVGEIGPGHVHLGIVGIPVKAGLCASLGFPAKSGHHLSGFHEDVNVDVVGRARQRHAHVAIVVFHRLE